MSNESEIESSYMSEIEEEGSSVGVFKGNVNEFITTLENHSVLSNQSNQEEFALDAFRQMFFKMLESSVVEVKVLDKELYDEFALPNAATADSAGYDLRSTKDFVIEPGQTVKVGTGLAFDMGKRFQACKLMPKSGLGSKGLILANTIGLIDADYQGEIICALYNRSGSQIKVERGTYIAQATFEFVFHPKLKVVENFSRTTVRGEGGFGSQGTK